MNKKNNHLQRTTTSKGQNAGIEVDGTYLPNHSAPAEGKVVEDGEEPTGADLLVAQALEHGKPEFPEAAGADGLSGEEGMPVGIQIGQTARGSYSTDQSTGGGGYRDHRAGQFGTDAVAQPGNDGEIEPDAVDKGF